MPTASRPLAEVPIRAATIDRAREILAAAPLTPAYRAAVTAALALPGNILSATPDARWARLVWTCCAAAGGRGADAVSVAAAVELFMVALDVLDDEEDGDDSALRAALGAACALNVSTGLLFMAQHSLLDAAGPTAAGILLHAGQAACAGQHADLVGMTDHGATLDESLAVTAGKSASLVAAMCRLGAVCAGADASAQDLYTRFGRYLGMILQLTNDLAAIQPGSRGKTDIARRRPTLPLTYAALRSPSAQGTVCDNETQALLWFGAPAYLTWAVAETYRGQASALLPQLANEAAHRAALARLLGAH